MPAVTLAVAHPVRASQAVQYPWGPSVTASPCDRRTSLITSVGDSRGRGFHFRPMPLSAPAPVGRPQQPFDSPVSTFDLAMISKSASVVPSCL